MVHAGNEEGERSDSLDASHEQAALHHRRQGVPYDDVHVLQRKITLQLARDSFKRAIMLIEYYHNNIESYYGAQEISSSHLYIYYIYAPYTP